MDANLHVNKPMDDAESLHGRRSEHSLLNVLTETIRGLGAVRRRRDHRDGTVGGRTLIGGEDDSEDEEEDEERGADEEREERECKQRVLGVLRELSVCHSDRVAAWRGVLREYMSPPGGSGLQHLSTAGM